MVTPEVATDYSEMRTQLASVFLHSIYRSIQSKRSSRIYNSISLRSFEIHVEFP